jgi:hypothetical protein
LVLLLTLSNLGIEIQPLLAGLGIGGIAVALAAQNILGDLFASLSITLDRPFVLGDTLQVDDFSGTVEYIGVKSTRLRSVNGEQIIMPNSNLVASRVRNLTRATDRRVVFTVGVGQETPLAELQKIPGLIRSLIEAYPDVRFDHSISRRCTWSRRPTTRATWTSCRRSTCDWSRRSRNRALLSRTRCSGCTSSNSSRCSRSRSANNCRWAMYQRHLRAEASAPQYPSQIGMPLAKAAISSSERHHHRNARRGVIFDSTK